MRGRALPTFGTSTFTSWTTGCLTVPESGCAASFAGSTRTRRYCSAQPQLTRVTYGRLCAQGRKSTSSSLSSPTRLSRRSRACFLPHTKRFLRLGWRRLPPYERSWPFDRLKTPNGWRKPNRNVCAQKRKCLGPWRRLPSSRLGAPGAISLGNGRRCFQKKCAPPVRLPLRASIEHEHLVLRQNPFTFSLNNLGKGI